MLSSCSSCGYEGLSGDLPSAEAAKDFVAGDMRAFVPLVGTTLMRAALIGTGLYVAGQREGLAKSAIAGALAIEVFVLGWAFFNKD